MHGLDAWGLLQWPAMAVTLVAAWLVGAQHKRKRSWGFWCFVVSYHWAAIRQRLHWSAIWERKHGIQSGCRWYLLNPRYLIVAKY